MNTNLNNVNAQDKDNLVARQNQGYFISAVQGINQRGLRISRDMLKSIDILGVCFEQAAVELQSDFDFIKDKTDEIDIRIFIREMLGQEGLRVFEDTRGEIQLDLVHALLLYYYKKKENSERTRIAKGLAYFLGGHHLDGEFGEILDVINKGVIKPALVNSVSNYRWKRCPHIINRYVSQLTIEEGYRTYEFNIPFFHHTMYLMKVEGLTMEEARAKVEKAQHGFFYTFLPIEVEDALMPAILSGDFSYHLMDGYYKQSLIHLEGLVLKENGLEFSQNYQYNVYTRFIKPDMCEIIGAFLGNLPKVLEREGCNDLGIFVEMVSPTHIAVKAPVNLPFLQIPHMSELFRPVQPFSLNGFLVGNLCR